MSRAFVKEEADVAERKARRRSAAGLPPGATNYVTAAGAKLLRKRMAAWRHAERKDPEAIAALERTLAGATIVEPQARRDVVTFGALVTVQVADGRLEIYRIVGVDEVELAPENASWVSPIGRALLGAEPGQRVIWAGDEQVARTIQEIA